MSKDRTPARRNTFTVSLILGLLLIPLSAVAAMALVDRGTPEVDESAPASADQVSAATTPVAATTGAESYTDADLAAACGADGWALVEKESGGMITGLEQAALDALRAICENAGMPLAGPPAPAPIVRTVRVTTPAPAAPPVASAPVDDAETTDTIPPSETAEDPDDLTDEGHHGAAPGDDRAANDEDDDRDEDHEEDHEDHHEDEEDDD